MKRTFELCTEEKICWIFGAGSFFGLYSRPKKGDLVIAADGGLKYLEELKIAADIVLGDFDSSENVPESGGERTVVRLSKTKDLSDSAAALALGKEKGYRLFYLYGCTGGRIDHTLANVQDLAALSNEGMQGYLFDDEMAVTVISAGNKLSDGEPSVLRFPEGMQGFISVFSHSDKSLGVREDGLKYTVADHVLTNSFPLGLSNEFTKLAGSVTLREGTLVVVFELQKEKA